MQKGSVFLGLAGPTVFVSLLLLGLCIVAAAYLYRQQAHTAEILDENVITRQIDHDLESTVEALIGLHRSGDDHVDLAQERFRELLAEAWRAAKHDKEH